jgi:Uma2 family endonuclease
MALDFRPHRLTTAEYEQMCASGALEDMRVELLDGLLVDMNPPSEPHNRALQALTMLFGSRLELVRVQMPLAVADGWMPEPDVALVEPDPDIHRRPATAHLVVEVSVTSHAKDRRKAGVYARAGVPRYWHVDLPAAEVFEHTEPGEDGYALVRRLSGHDMLDAGVDGIAPTTVDALFGPFAGTDAE